MSFQAPDTDADASAGFKAPEDDLDPPKSLEGFLGNVVSNAGRAINPLNIAKGLGSTVKQGLYDIPKAAAESSIDLLKGTAKAAMGEGLPSADDVANTPLLKQAREMTEPIAKDPVGYLYKNPVDAALLASGAVAPFLGGEGAAEAAGNVSRGTSGAAEAAAGAAKAPKELPVMPPGAKTGDPHALFAYNDKFGPGGTERSIYNVFGDPEHPSVKAVGHGSSVTRDILDKNGIPVTGREPRSVGKYEPIEGAATPPPGEAGGAKAGPEPAAEGPRSESTPPPKEDPFKDVRDYVNSKYQRMDAQGGWPERMAKYLKDEAGKLGAKDIGLQGRQIQSMGQGFEGLQKAEALVDYAREKGYLDPSLTDTARRDKIIATMKTSGQNLDAIRNVADKRGAPPMDAIKAAVKQELESKYGPGVEHAPREVRNVMVQLEKAKPTFSGMSELATQLNKAKTKVKDLGQHPGPTTDAANIISRINNDALRGTLNPQESELYTKSLRDFGAHKKLEQATAGAGRREMAARSNQRGVLGRLWQEALDRGGYRLGGNIANKVADTVLKNPGKIKTLPQFFEELAHTSDEALDDSLGISGMAKGGVVVPKEVRDYVQSRSC